MRKKTWNVESNASTRHSSVSPFKFVRVQGVGKRNRFRGSCWDKEIRWPLFLLDLQLTESADEFSRRNPTPQHEGCFV